MNLLELVDAAMAELEPARVQPSRNDDPLDEIAAVFSEFDPAIILPKQSVNEARVVETTTDTPPGQDEVSGGVYVRTLNPDHGRPVSRWFTVKPPASPYGDTPGEFLFGVHYSEWLRKAKDETPQT